MNTPSTDISAKYEAFTENNLPGEIRTFLLEKHGLTTSDIIQEILKNGRQTELIHQVDLFKRGYMIHFVTELTYLRELDTYKLDGDFSQYICSPELVAFFTYLGFTVEKGLNGIYWGLDNVLEYVATYTQDTQLQQQIAEELLTIESSMYDEENNSIVGEREKSEIFQNMQHTITVLNQRMKEDDEYDKSIYNKFLPPNELTMLLKPFQITQEQISGLIYYHADVLCNYIEMYADPIDQTSMIDNILYTIEDQMQGRNDDERRMKKPNT